MKKRRSSEYGLPTGKRDKSNPLRNVYQSGDETGNKAPDDGSTFEGLNQNEDDDD